MENLNDDKYQELAERLIKNNELKHILSEDPDVEIYMNLFNELNNEKYCFQKDFADAVIEEIFLIERRQLVLRNNLTILLLGIMGLSLFYFMLVFVNNTLAYFIIHWIINNKFICLFTLASFLLVQIIDKLLSMTDLSTR